VSVPAGYTYTAVASRSVVKFETVGRPFVFRGIIHGVGNVYKSHICDVIMMYWKQVLYLA